MLSYYLVSYILLTLGTGVSPCYEQHGPHCADHSPRWLGHWYGLCGAQEGRILRCKWLLSPHLTTPIFIQFFSGESNECHKVCVMLQKYRLWGQVSLLAWHSLAGSKSCLCSVTWHLTYNQLTHDKLKYDQLTHDS